MPSWLVTKSFVSPVSILLSVTLAPATTAPEVSATVPRISPVFLLWETTGLAIPTTTQNASAKRNNPFIESLHPRKLTIHPETASHPAKPRCAHVQRAVVSVLIDPGSTRCSNEPISEHTTGAPNCSAAMRDACGRGEKQPD